MAAADCDASARRGNSEPRVDGERTGWQRPRPGGLIHIAIVDVGNMRWGKVTQPHDSHGLRQTGRVPTMNISTQIDPANATGQ